MADLYVRSTDGSNTDNGTTWALAKATLAGATAIDVAGDNIYISQAHAESSATAQVIALAGTLAAPVKVICGSDSAEPPTSVSTATITTTGNSAFTFTGSGYFYGLSFRQGTGAVSPTMALASSDGDRQVFENCEFQMLGTGASQLRIGSTSVGTEAYCKWSNCNIKFSNAGQYIRPQSTSFRWSGGAALAGTSPTSLISASGGSYCQVIIDGVDLSALDAGLNLFSITSGGLQALIRNCKLPVGWSGSLCSSFMPGSLVEMHNCDSGDTNYRLWTSTAFGDVKQDTVIVRTGGASDGTTPLSWNMTASADARYPHTPLESPEIVVWNDTTGIAKTVTVEVITDNVTLTDAECWVDVQYLGTVGFPLGVFVSDAKASVLATAANQATSAEAWTTTGLTTPIKQKLSVTFTPQEKGFIHAKVMLAKPSATVYVCPKVTVT